MAVALDFNLARPPLDQGDVHDPAADGLRREHSAAGQTPACLVGCVDLRDEVVKIVDRDVLFEETCGKGIEFLRRENRTRIKGHASECERETRLLLCLSGRLRIKPLLSTGGKRLLLLAPLLRTLQTTKLRSRILSRNHVCIGHSRKYLRHHSKQTGTRPNPFHES